MNTKKVLLMHISQVSGHRCASLAIEKALHELDQQVQAKSIDAFNYTNPYLEKFINGIYMFVIQSLPWAWNYLYDNKDILRRTKGIRTMLHRINDRKIAQLLAQYQPDIIVCTQAFPCGMVADYKRRHGLKLPLIGVLTDYAPHLYWLNEFVDIYVVPAEKIQEKLMQRGVSCERLKILGIPIEPKFNRHTNPEETLRNLGLNAGSPVILIMGGGQGLGPMKKIVCVLDKLSRPLQLIVVCGTNHRLYHWLKKHQAKFKKSIAIMGYTERIDALMDASTFVVGKPGGLTTAEALSKALPIIIVNPLPGQESQNSAFLLESGLALKANNLSELSSLAEELLVNIKRLEQLRKKAKQFAHTDSAFKIAQLILQTLETAQNRIDN